MVLEIKTPRSTVWQTVLKVLLLIVSLSIFGVLAAKARQGFVTTDVKLLDQLHTYTNPAFDTFFSLFTVGGEPLFVALFMGLVALLYALWRNYPSAGFLVLATLGAIGLIVGVKLLISRDRPDLWATLVHETGYSFPSGHALMSAVAALSLMTLAWPYKGRWLVVVLGGLYIGLIGFSRLYLGVHFPTDVVGGWCLALAWVIILQLGGQLMHSRRRSYE